MLTSHHSHSGQFCRHAKGTLRQVLDTALSKGFQLYGLSEHMPRFREQDLYPEEAGMSCAELNSVFEQYLREAMVLQQEYAAQLTVLIGLETDFVYPSFLEELRTLLLKNKDIIQYVVGSVHHVQGVPIDFDRPTFDQALALFDGSLYDLFDAYFDAQYALLQTVQPEVIGHFDLCRIFHPGTALNENTSTWAKVTRNLDYVKSYGGLVEVNAAAFRKGWQTAYPGLEVLDYILQNDIRLCLSDDSHGPHAVALHYEDAFNYLFSRGVKKLFYLDKPKDTEQPIDFGRRKLVIRKADPSWVEKYIRPV